MYKNFILSLILALSTSTFTLSAGELTLNSDGTIAEPAPAAATESDTAAPEDNTPPPAE